MKKLTKKLTALLVILTVVLTAACLPQKDGGSITSLDDMITQSAGALQDALKQEEELQDGSPTRDWSAMVCAFAGQKDDGYLKRLETYIADQYRTKGSLSNVKATEYYRASLTILALGGNPEDIEQDGIQMNLIADGTWNFPGGSPGLQGANGLIYALLVLDSKNYDTGQTDLREQYMEELLTYQKNSGAFCIDNSLDGSVDITAMALQAMAPYRGDPEVNASAERALNWLESQMTEEGTFADSEVESAESCAQVVLALCALGQDPDEAPQFVKNEQSVLDGLNSYRMENGMYMHEHGADKENIMATYQSLLALEAVQKQRNEQLWIFDFTDQEAATE